jgi:hypothetical protein
MIMKNLTFAVVMFVLLGGIPTLSGHGPDPLQEPKKPNDASKELRGLMKRKLESSQKVLEALAMNNFDQISKHAGELVSLSNQAEWKALRTPEYEFFSNDFRRSANEMVKKAKDKNIDGATLAYVQLTFSCVRCHKYVREVRNVQIELPNRLLFAESGR